MFDESAVRYAFHESHLDVTAPIRLDGETIGYVHIDASLTQLYSTLATYGWIALGVSVLALLGAYVATLRLQRDVAAPLVGLVEVMQHVSKHQDYEVRAGEAGNDEIGALITGFNPFRARSQR